AETLHHRRTMIGNIPRFARNDGSDLPSASALGTRNEKLLYGSTTGGIGPSRSSDSSSGCERGSPRPSPAALKDGGGAGVALRRRSSPCCSARRISLCSVAE